MPWMTEPLGPKLWEALRGLAGSGSDRQKKHLADLARYRAANAKGPGVQEIDTSGFPERMAEPAPPPAAGKPYEVLPEEKPAAPKTSVMGTPVAPAAPAPQQGNFAGFDGTPEILSASMGLTGLGEEGASLDEQLQQAIALRDTASPEMRGNGRVMTAANPLEHLATGMNRMRGFREEKATRAEQKTLRGEQKAGRKALMDAIARQMGVRTDEAARPIGEGFEGRF